MPPLPDFVNCQGAVVTRSPEDLRVAAMGDLVFDVRAEANSEAFSSVRALLQEADFAFGNLEGAITERTAAAKAVVPGRSYAFRFPPGTATLIRDANIDVVSIANNHSNDYGPAGYADSVRHLRAAGVQTTGEPGTYVVQDVRGLRVALVAFGHYSRFNSILDLEGAARVVAKARSEADVVIVTHQGGAEGAAAAFLKDGTEMFLGENRGDVRAFARTVIGAGASLVVGHGPHVVRGAECVDGRPVLHSIGNFISIGGLNTLGLSNVSVFFEALLDRRGAVRGVRVVPMMFSGGLPIRDENGRALHLINALSERAAALPGFKPLRFPGFESTKDAYRQWAASIPVLR